MYRKRKENDYRLEEGWGSSPSSFATESSLMCSRMIFLNLQTNLSSSSSFTWVHANYTSPPSPGKRVRVSMNSFVKRTSLGMCVHDRVNSLPEDVGEPASCPGRRLHSQIPLEVPCTDWQVGNGECIMSGRNK